MANAMALVNEGLWRKDRDFQKLSRSAQCTYVQILSQKDLDTAGGLTLHLDLMAKACHELTVDQLRDDLEELEALRFVFVDYDTDELLVRSYVRLVSAVGAPKNRAWLSVPKNARLIASPKLRHELAKELRRLRLAESDALADEIDPNPEPPSDSLPTPSKNEGGSDPLSTSQVPDLVSPSVVGLVGEDRPHCKKHPNGNAEDEPCAACGRRREWDKQHEADELARQRDKRAADAGARRAAIKACARCDEYGMYELSNFVVKCTHQEAVNA